MSVLSWTLCDSKENAERRTKTKNKKQNAKLKGKNSDAERITKAKKTSQTQASKLQETIKREERLNLTCGKLTKRASRESGV